MSSGVAYEVRPFDGRSAPSADDLAALHAALLGSSPVALLGPRFMKELYYSELPRMGLIFGAVAYIDREPAGFIVATADAFGFMAHALRRKFLKLARIMLVSVLEDRKRLGAIWEAVQIMRGQPRGGQAASPVGEILSFGVLPQFRSREFAMRSRLRVGQDLLNSVMTQFGSRGVSSIRAIVDADNLEARLFYLANGWTPGMSRVSGWRAETVELLWGASESAAARS